MVCLVRSEDRKPSRRVFPLLQNLDLDTVTFSQVQSTGEPITIQDMNEQEMLDLIIVNLARLAVAGEWTGLLEAGGGSFNAEITSGDDIESTYALNRVDCTPPWGVNLGNNGQGSRDEPMWYPFLAPESSTVAGIVVNISAAAASACNGVVAIYSDNNGVPYQKLGSDAIFDAESAGQVEQTSVGTLELVRGTQYWVGFTRSAAVSFTWMTTGGANLPWFGPTENLSSAWYILWIPSGSNNTLPATVTATDLAPRGYYRISVGINQ